ncbi:xanthine dehydrogenase family protein molybdopterin-binding subunit [Sphingomonas ginkgonis]|uniref:Xanthine dehydrogenase family protein molybdopterin-binding subunit n=1 Tax=Sphingomonas ginkgonis TaxID=2315330 RepID=A0A3R9YMT6_9SPHN|nr:molybdopterin cofactor-binding domain-containing protein [Sphingomonas ginkgonis]RST31095.1 xanthine dehydrogenase family protein molybdopterin-binding subunit [Sphingomonas ginkgonis]
MTAATRREVLAGAGITVLFSLAGPALAQQAGSGGGEQQGGGEPQKVRPDLPGDLAKFPALDSWIRIDGEGRATVFTGKAELGQGMKTALTQLAADELDIPLEQVTLVTADTARTPNEGVTAGSHTLQDSGTAIANAAANVRYLLAEQAAQRWNLPITAVRTRRGTVLDGGSRSVSYAELARSVSLHVPARPGVPRKRMEGRHFIGRDVPRVDIPGKLTGAPAYVHDLSFPDMLHARVVRGPHSGTRLFPNVDALRRLPGVEQVVTRGRFVAMLGPREWPLVRALRLAGQIRSAPTGRVPSGSLSQILTGLRDQPSTILDRHADPALVPTRSLAADYSRPWLMHGSIGPSCALALFRDGQLTVWTHTQGVEPLRGALAELTSLPKERIRCIHAEGAGCYGHNGADDVAADAALAAIGVPGRPVRLQWSREQEHGWEPMGPAQLVRMRGGVDATGRIAAWEHQVWSNTHSTRPAKAGDLLAGQEVDQGFQPTPVKPIPQPEGGGDRNSVPLYAFPNARVVSHFLPDMPMRVSALRSLGAHMNVFAIESFIDELAHGTGHDPVAYRLAHLTDARGRAVIEKAAQRFGWSANRRAPNRGAGFAFARYKNLGAYCAIAMDVEVERETGRLTVHRAVAAVDSGEAVNPDGIRNQIEGGIVQSLSWSSVEQAPYTAAGRTAFDWSSYPILRFDGVPRAVTVEVIDRPGQPFLGTGEAAQGPTAAALANAVFAACGQRLRSMPLRPAKN